MSNNSNDEVERLTAELERKKAAKALRNRQRSPRNNNSNDPTIPLNVARQMALNANKAYERASRAPSRASSRASSPSRSQTPGRRSRAELINKYRRNLANFNTRRASGTLGKSKTHTVNQRRALIKAKLNSQIAANALARAKSVARNEVKRAQSVARNETKRAQSAARLRAEAEAARRKEEEKAKRAANKAAGIVVPKPPKLSANEELASIRAKAKANAEAIHAKARALAEAEAAKARAEVARIEERAARREELLRQKAALEAVRNQKKAQESSVKAAKERADLEEKCASLGWRKP